MTFFANEAAKSPELYRHLSINVIFYAMTYPLNFSDLMCVCVPHENEITVNNFSWVKYFVIALE